MYLFRYTHTEPIHALLLYSCILRLLIRLLIRKDLLHLIPHAHGKFCFRELIAFLLNANIAIRLEKDDTHIRYTYLANSYCS
jgi:hypothetical protein